MNYSTESLLPLPVLERIRELPIKPIAVTLEGEYVRLMPLDLTRDVATLFTVSNGSAITQGDKEISAYNPVQKIWQFMSAGPFANVYELAAFLQPQIEASSISFSCSFSLLSSSKNNSNSGSRPA